MYYQQGDYYRGDYYRGDPGIFSIFGRVARVVGGAALGFVRGGPTGAIAGAVGGTALAVRSGIETETLGAGGSQSAYTPALRAQHAEVLARGGAGKLTRGGLAMQGGGAGGQLGAGLALMPHVRRMHLNRSTYVTRGGGTSRWPVGLQVHVKGTEPVPSRRMNVTNPRALRRALRRAQGFGKIVRRMKRAIARANSAVGNIHRARKLPGVRRR
jgi:hypothetical protein